MKWTAILKLIISVAIHLVFIVLLAYLFYPIASWYFNHRPIIGVDFFNTVSYAKIIRDNFVIPPMFFKYFWYGGSPLFSEFLIIWFYVIALVSKFFPLLVSVKLSMIASFFLLLAFTYLAAYRLSKHHFLSLALAALVAYSANMYGSLVWGGSLPYFANQLFLPLVLWLMVSYLDTGNKRWYWAAIVSMGIAILGHALNAGAFMLPSAMLLILLGRRNKPIKASERIKESLVFFVGAMLVSLRVSRSLLEGLVGGIISGGLLSPFVATESRIQLDAGEIVAVGNEDIIAFERGRFEVLFSDTNQWIYLLFGLSFAVLLVALVADRKKSRIFSLFPWMLILGYAVLHVFLNAYGIPLLPQAWYRAFWQFPVLLALFVAAVFGYSQKVFSSGVKLFKYIYYVGFVAVSLFVLGVTFQADAAGEVIGVLEEKSSPSSAYPEAINLVTSDRELEELRSDLTPDWLDASNRNWRLYESDAQVNVWWNSQFDMPLFRGYIDPPLGTDKMGQIFLADQALGADGIVNNFDYPEDVAKNMALYYLDWNAIRYFEGGHVSISDNKKPSSYLADSIAEQLQTKTVGLYRLYQTESGKPEIQDIPQYLDYYRFEDDLVTPVVSVSNAPAVLFIGDWPGYESLLKVLSMNNLNSRYLVSVYSDERIDSFTEEELSSFDAVILANYRYGSQAEAFAKLERYVSSGGRVLIDTGSEVKESEAINLPEFFPFSSTERNGLGKSWKIEISNMQLFEEVDLSKFSPPVFNGDEWKFSYPDVELGSEVGIILQHGGKPLLASWELGKGKIIWSGMNLAYHVHANTNFEESKLYVNLLETMVDLDRNEIRLGEADFTNSRRVGYSSQESGKGVLFKEQLYPGWRVKLNGKKVRAFAAGPAFPGYMYVPLSGEGSVNIEFTYWGQVKWYLVWGLQVFVIVVLLDLSIFNGWFVGRRVSRVGKRLVKHVSRWWEKEED